MPWNLSACSRSTFTLAMHGAVLLWAALPPLGLWPIAWIAPAGWILLIRKERLLDDTNHDDGSRLLRPACAIASWLCSRHHPYRVLWLAGFVFWMATYHWLRLPHWASFFGWVAAAFYMGFYLPVFIAIARVAVHRVRVPVILAAPIVWVGLELARAHLLTGITMGDLGHTQYRWITLIQLSDLTGAYGVSFLVMFVAACLGRMIPCDDKRWAWWPLAPAVGLVTVALMYGYLRTSGEYTTPGARVALIQECIDSKVKSDPEKQEDVTERYKKLSKKATEQYENIDLMIWPETMFRDGLFMIDDDAVMPQEGSLTEETFEKLREYARTNYSLANTARNLGVPLILGVDRHHFTASGQTHFNSAVHVTGNGQILGWYDKNHLVLFGEYVPFVKRIPWLQNLTPVGTSIDPGVESAAFEVNGIRYAPNICYETVLPHVIRRQVRQLADSEKGEPDVLVNLTNDGWFYGSSELDLHLMCGVFRAIECRKPLLIAANTGISAWIDGDGRIRRRGPSHDTAVILAKVELDRRTSWYAQNGDWFAGICLILSLALAGWGVRAGRFPVGFTHAHESVGLAPGGTTNGTPR